jgi:hypothetical protein
MGREIDELDQVVLGPLPPRVVKLLKSAVDNGWEANAPGITFRVRLTKPDDDLALPFFIGWDLYLNPETAKWSWRFSGARAKNGQPMNFNDVFTYLEDPSVIYPEPPEEL